MANLIDIKEKSGSTKRASPWNVRGVSNEARNGARLASRRAGKSLGEWLEAVVMAAAHAELKSPGVPTATTEDTLAAILAQLEKRDQAMSELAQKVDALQRRGLLARLFGR